MMNIIKLPVKELPTLRKVHNPYHYLQEPHLMEILRSRDLALQTSIRKLPDFLNTYDREVDSSYLDTLLNSNYNILTNKAEIFLIASLKGVPFQKDYNYLASPNISVNFLKGYILSSLIWLSLPPENFQEEKVNRKIPLKELLNRGEMMKKRLLLRQSSKESVSPPEKKPLKLPHKNLLEFLSSLSGDIKITPEDIPPIIKDILSAYSPEEQVNILMGIIHYPIKHITNSVYWSLWLYPLNSLQDNPIILTTSTIKYLTSVLSRPEMIFYITRGFLDPHQLKDYKKKARRNDHLNKFFMAYENRDERGIMFDLLFNLYQINFGSRDNPLSILTIKTYENVNPFETFILQSRLRICEALGDRQVKEIGMIIPPTISPNRIPNYYYQNILDYQDVYSLLGEKNRDLLIEERYLRDQEILDRFNIYVPYQSRKHLLEYIEELKTQPKFFYPYKRKCSNKEFLTTLESTERPEIFTVAYGTLKNYFCFEKDDIMMSFVQTDIVYFRDLVNPNRVYKREDIDDLLELYKRFPQGNDDVINYLEKSLSIFNRSNNYDMIMLNEFINLQKEDKIQIKAILYDIFYLGMYMRRWKGFGDPYPLSENATKISYDPENNILMAFSRLRNCPLNQNIKKFLDLLRIVNREGSPTERFLMKQLRIIERSEENPLETCIRVNSSRIIYTIYYALQNLFNEKIPNFNLHSFEEIY